MRKNKQVKEKEDIEILKGGLSEICRLLSQCLSEQQCKKV